MSYECCKRINLDKKKNSIKVCIASNNVFPKTYSVCGYCEGDTYKEYSFRDKLICLFASMQSGSIQITSINDNTEKFEYALIKVSEWLKQNNIDSYEDLYIKRGEIARQKRLKVANIVCSKNEDRYKRESEDWEAYRQWADKQDKQYVKKLEEKIYLESLYEVYGKAFEVWEKALMENIKGEYKVKYNNYYEISKLGKYDRGYGKFYYTSLGNGLKMNYKKAYILIDNMGNGRNLEIVKV